MQTCHAERVILYLHGNACDIGEVFCNIREEASNWRAIIALIEYPGYGMSPGYSSSEGIDRHVRIAFDHFTKKMGVPSSRIVLFGCSVGTGPSAKLAAALQKEGTPVGCIVMQSPYTSIREAAASLVGFVAYIIFERWDTAGYLRKVSAPLLIVHGTEDEVIPFGHATSLKELREKEHLPVQFYAQQGATHNNYDVKWDLSEPVRMFLREHHAQSTPMQLNVRPAAVDLSIGRMVRGSSGQLAGMHSSNNLSSGAASSPALQHLAGSGSAASMMGGLGPSGSQSSSALNARFVASR